LRADGTIVIALVAIVATVFTAGAAAIAMGALGSGTTLAGASLATIMTTGGAALTGTTLGATGLGAAVIGGAVGNAVSQGVAIAIGMQEDFSWKGVATGALERRVRSSHRTGTLRLRQQLHRTLPRARAHRGDRCGQQRTAPGVMVATGLQKKFNWAAVAATAVSAPVAEMLHGRHPGRG
jgi:hypothetical protein